MNIKKLTALIITLIALVSVVGVVGAQEDAQPNRPDRGGARGRVMQVIAEATGLEPQAIAEQVQSGATLAEVIEGAGASVDAVVDTLLADTRAQIEAMLNGEGPDRPRPCPRPNPGQSDNAAPADGDQVRPDCGPDRQRGQGARQVVNAAAEATGLEIEAIVEQIQGGATLSEIITANGATVEQVVDIALAPIVERMTQRVDAGEMTQEEMDARLAEITEQLTNRINNAGQAPAEGV